MATVHLTDGVLKVDVLPDEGGRIAALWSEHDGTRTDWFYPKHAAGPGATGWGSFPLVPFSNRIRNGRFSWKDRVYDIAVSPKHAPHAIHGHGRDLTWQIDAVAAEAVELSYSYPGDDWPFPYSARQRIAIEDGALVIAMALCNEGTAEMPAGLGHHPYMPWRDGPTLETRFETSWPARDAGLPTGPEPVPVELDFSSSGTLPRGLDIGLAGWSRQATIRWPQQGAVLDVDADLALGHVVIFTPDGCDFFCFEPVSHCTNALNLSAVGIAGTGQKTLAPGEVFEVSMRFRPTVDDA